MRRLLLLLALSVPAAAQQPFTLQQILSAPYALSLTAAPVGARFAWIENAEGVRNIWVGGPSEPARQITHYTEDDGQDISNLAWSPDASAIAYTYGAENGAAGKPANPANLQRNTALQIRVAHLSPKLAEDVIAEGRAPLYSADGNDIFFLRGGQIWHIANADRKDFKTEQLVYDRGSASQLTLSPGGKQLAFVSTRTHAGHTQSFIALFDLVTKTLRILAASTHNDFAPAFSPDGKRIAWLRYPSTRLYEFAANRISPNPWSIQLYDLTTDTAHKVFSPEPNKPGSVLPHMATGSPRLFFAINNRIVFYGEMDGWVHLYSTSVDSTNPPQLLTPGADEVEDAVISRDGKFILYASNKILVFQSPKNVGFGPISARTPPAPDLRDADSRQIWKVDLEDLTKVSARYSNDEGIESHPQVASDGTIAALMSDGSFPSMPYLLPERHHPVQMHLLHGPLTWGYITTKPEQVFFDASDGIHLHGQLIQPRAEADSSTTEQAQHPAIIYMHGGPRRQMLLGYPASDYYSNDYAFNQYLASRGFIVLSVNYRCGIGYGLDFRECEHAGPTGAAEYADVLAAAQYLRSRPDVDTKRIGLWGGSYGGYLTALGLARNSDIFAAGVDFHGVHEWSLEDDGTIWPKGSTRASVDAADALAHASSPMADIDKWKSPVLLIQGDDDPDVAYAQTPLLADALRARGVPVEELIFPNEVHDFLLHKDWLAAFEAAAAFFERTLKP